MRKSVYYYYGELTARNSEDYKNSESVAAITDILAKKTNAGIYAWGQPDDQTDISFDRVLPTSGDFEDVLRDLIPYLSDGIVFYRNDGELEHRDLRTYRFDPKENAWECQTSDILFDLRMVLSPSECNYLKADLADGAEKAREIGHKLFDGNRYMIRQAEQE